VKIGIEATALARKQRTGVDFYTYTLVKEMASLDKDNEFLLPYLYFYSKPKPDLGFEGINNVFPKRIGFMPGKIYNGLFRYLLAPPLDLLGMARAEVYLFPNFVRWPLLFTRKSAVIVYDLSFIQSTSTSASRLRSYLTKFVPKAVNKAQIVVTISENSKKELVETYGTNPEKIVVATPGVDLDFFYPRTADESKEILAKYGIADKSYILFTGTIEPRKNLTGLLKAYELLDAKISKKFPLVLAGGKGWLDEEIHQTIVRLRINGLSVIQTGYLPYEELPVLYSRASVFVFPSFYEGFGMPPLEAMACGTPAITSNNSSLPEVMGDAGIMVDARDNGALTQAITEVLTDEVKAARMSKLGIQRAKLFSWQKSARIVLDALEKLGGTL